MKKTYIRPTMSAEQVEASQVIATSFGTSDTPVTSGWTKEESGNEDSFDTSSLWDSQW